MMLNLPGVLVAFNALIRPRILLPSISVPDIRHLDFVALRRAGYRGAVFDKDNCLTIPHKDALVPELRSAWEECKEVFGPGNVLIVSNSAGTRRDYGDIQAESVTHHLGAPVLRHSAMKPAHACVTGVRTYFASLRQPIRASELLVVGDRVFTDVVLASRLRAADEKDQQAAAKMHTALGDGGGAKTLVEGGKGTLAVLTTGIWKKESMFMRMGEAVLVKLAKRWQVNRTQDGKGELHLNQYVRLPLPAAKSPARASRAFPTRWM